jgi:hypothetical protein
LFAPGPAARVKVSRAITDAAGRILVFTIAHPNSPAGRERSNRTFPRPARSFTPLTALVITTGAGTHFQDRVGARYNQDRDMEHTRLPYPTCGHLPEQFMVV